ncbi:MAG: hydroxyquinol 1,2-dioxygenase [Hyphomicrobiales bacterium]|nr:hydroxyquinol 1,2-dioxygenase [Hyphomicrobiales bacterium]
MRSVTKNNITETFLSYMAEDTSPRVGFLLERLAHHLHAFARETELTHAEWRKGIELLTRAGEMTDAERNEFVLFSDVLGLSSLVDMISSREGSTSSSVLGPFHILGAPELPYGGDLKQGNDGATVIVSGKVSNQRGDGIAGAEIELWQTADNGLYSNQDETQPDYNLRCRLRTDDQGRLLFTTVRPAPYTVPDDGPVGELLHATGRHPWRPSHLHFIITADGYRTLVTEIFPDDDPYLDADAVFGVREDLLVAYVECADNSAVPAGLDAAGRLTTPYFTVDLDFVLADR